MAHQIAQGRLPAGLLAAVEVDVVQLLQTAREHVAHLVKLLIVIHNVQIFFAVLFAHAHDDEVCVLLQLLRGILGIGTTAR